jgi:hypothetical protein
MDTIQEIPVLASQQTKAAAGYRSAPATATVNTRLTWWDRHAAAFEKARFGWMAMLITFQSCLGAAACMYILKNDASVFVLATCAAVSMGSNALFIALAKAKVAMAGFYISVLVNTIFLIMNVQL